MRVLVVNAGSSSVKLDVVGDGDTTIAHRVLGPPTDPSTPGAIVDFIESCEPVDVVGHRIVHGGPSLREATIITEGVRQRLEDGAAIDPLHVPPALKLVDLCMDRLTVPHVACFDTAFHTTMPVSATTYAIPRAWRALGIRRYGFHGLSFAWSAAQAAREMKRPLEDLHMVLAHLGSGSSVCAVRGGRSVDTSMGFTPVEGLVMGTRSGTVDPGALLWLQTQHGFSATALSDDIEHHSGLLGLTETSDMRVVLSRAEAGDDIAAAGRDIYLHRAAREIAAMTASLERLDALVFTGAIGENAPAIRDGIVNRLRCIGAGPDTGGAQSDGGTVLVIAAREDLQISREVRSVVTTEVGAL